MKIALAKLDHGSVILNHFPSIIVLNIVNFLELLWIDPYSAWRSLWSLSLNEWTKETHKSGSKCVNLNFRDMIYVEKNLIAYDWLITNPLQERRATTSKITSEYISLMDDEIILTVGLNCFEESITTETKCLRRLLSNSSNHLEALMWTHQSNVAKHVYNELIWR